MGVTTRSARSPSLRTSSPKHLPAVARLNTIVDTVGLVALAGLMFALRAYLASLILLWLGPVQYMGWMTTSPHWSFIGLVSLAGLLPMALAARSLGLLSRRAANVWIAAGIVALAVCALMRESIGMMGLMLTLGTIAILGICRHRLLPLLVAAAVAVLACMTPRGVVDAVERLRVAAAV